MKKRKTLAIKIFLLMIMSFSLVFFYQYHMHFQAYLNQYIENDHQINHYFNTTDTSEERSDQIVYDQLRSLYETNRDLNASEFKQYLQSIGRIKSYTSYYMIDREGHILQEQGATQWNRYFVLLADIDSGEQVFIDTSTLSKQQKQKIVNALKVGAATPFDNCVKIAHETKEELSYHVLPDGKVINNFGEIVGEDSGGATSSYYLPYGNGVILPKNSMDSFSIPTYLEVNGEVIIKGDNQEISEMLITEYSDENYAFYQLRTGFSIGASSQQEQQMPQMMLMDQQKNREILKEAIIEAHLLNDNKQFTNALNIHKEGKQYYGISLIPIDNKPSTLAEIDKKFTFERGGYLVTMKQYPYLEEQMQARYFTEYRSVYMLSFLVAVLISLLCAYMIARPIRKIEKIANKIAHNDFDDKIKIRTHDELGMLADSVNAMSDQLKMTITKLHDEIKQVKRLEAVRKDFIANFTHEMKTPLAIINGYTELLDNCQDTQKQQQYLRIIDEESMRLDNLIKAMLRLSKLESSKVELMFENVDIETMLTRIIDTFEFALQEKAIQVKMHTQTTIIAIDKSHMDMVFHNFISNAIRHCTNNGVITIHLNDTLFSIENEGETIVEDCLVKIWEPFHSGDKQGTGLGLAICKNILLLHSFTYGVENTEHGVRFSIYFNA